MKEKANVWHALVVAENIQAIPYIQLVMYEYTKVEDVNHTDRYNRPRRTCL